MIVSKARSLKLNYYICLDVVMMLFYFQGIPESAEVAVPVAHFPTSQTTDSGAAPVAPVSGVPNSSPLNMFPQVNLRLLMYFDHIYKFLLVLACTGFYFLFLTC